VGGIAAPRSRPPGIHTIFHASVFVLEECREFGPLTVLRKGLSVENKSDTVALLRIAGNSQRQSIE
jgi:hypothetical protein